MCGVFVAFNHGGLGSSDQESLVAAVALAAHRGPNNMGHWSDAHCFLGHNRLAIIDLDPVANQPFQHEQLIMTYNGEIFNYQELRVELESLGRVFRTESDTEVVLQSFAQWGGECFSRFNGMWALVIYDSVKHELTVSRDRFGQKPLFVRRHGNQAFFASEFQQLTGLGDESIDYELIQRFLKEGTYEGHGRTFFNEIQEFPKAHNLSIDANGRWVSHDYWRYWQGAIRETDQRSLDRLGELLSDSVRLRLKSDVPFGLLVSGGVDSTFVAHHAREISGDSQPLLAFSFSSEDQYDEQEYARRAARQLNMDLQIRRQDQDPQDYIDRLRTLVRHLGRGHSSPAIVSIDYLYESVSRAGVRVALDGQGADELLAGYKNYHMLVIPWYFLRGQFRQAWLVTCDMSRMGLFSSAVLFLRNVLPAPLKKLMRSVYGYERLFRPVPHKIVPRFVEVQQCAGQNGNLLNRYLIRQHTLGLENLLYYGDIVAMRSGVENRSPFMDHRLVEHVFQHDDRMKLWDAVDKYALRSSPIYDLYRDFLDRSKIGFSSDIKEATKLRMLDDLRMSPILKWSIFSDHMTRFLHSSMPLTAKYERLFFRIYQVHLWNDIFVQSRNAVTAPSAGH